MYGLAAWGLGIYALCLWHARDDQRMRRLAENRWWLDRRMVWRLRRGRLSRDEWFGIYMRRQRRLVKWGLGVVTVLWLAACVVGRVNALHGID